MKILCSDLEGTLAPEIWQEIGKEFKVPELDLTTRDIPDFDRLMSTRMSALQKKKINYEILLEFLNNILTINFDKKFLPRRGRVNCSLNDGGKWRWFGTQFVITEN